MGQGIGGIVGRYVLYVQNMYLHSHVYSVYT